ncbi:MAG TPA: hypothetical protein VJR69_01030 [Nitrospira sp.]|nr:hypothetical protein [Nitrospira sp.]
MNAETASSNISVVHLVRKKNGIEPFKQFLESYLKYPAGIRHELLILYKGFTRSAERAPYEALLSGVRHSFLTVADFGFDLRAYFIAAERSTSEYLCFLNSFAVLMDKDWLLKLYRHIRKPDVGLVGATGSWGSLRSGQVRKLPLWKKILKPFVRPARRAYFDLYFDTFPNYHIRTNGFMISRNTMGRIRRGVILTKMQVYRLESGKNSITKQVEQMGLTAVVVGKDGLSYDKEEWASSGTFWRGDQSNLLISDNQTRNYDNGDADDRRMRQLFAWGSFDSRLADGSGER